MQSLLILLGILPFSLAIPTNTYTNITIPPFIPALPDPPYNKTTHIPFGTVLNHCSVPGSIALTFDDGPYIYTPQVLDALAYHGARATFFLNGRNRGHITQFPELVRRAHEEGHQLGSHTWSHPSLPSLPAHEIKNQMTTLENAFVNILGFYPTYMRAPFLEHSPAVLDTLAQLGYHVIGASIDTKDYENDNVDTNWRSFEKFRGGLEAGGSVVLAHDSHRATAEILVDNMLEEIGRRGLKAVTIGECLGDESWWYRTGR